MTALLLFERLTLIARAGLVLREVFGWPRRVLVVTRLLARRRSRRCRRPGAGRARTTPTTRVAAG